MEKHFAFAPVSYENLGHIAVGEVGGANLGAATMMLAAVLRSPPIVTKADRPVTY